MTAQNKTVERIALSIHAIGLLPFVAGASLYALILYIYNLYDGALIFLISLVILLVVVGALKLITRVQRPPDAMRPATWSAFPSGHAASVAFIAIMVPYTLAQSFQWEYVILIAAILSLIAVIVALSRMVLHVHTTFQVAVGLALGIGIPLTCIAFAEQLRSFFF
ncbi:MAG: phosphatase PAP2 family protein [Patescibacteria group bacterium]